MISDVRGEHAFPGLLSDAFLSPGILNDLQILQNLL